MQDSTASSRLIEPTPARELPLTISPDSTQPLVNSDFLKVVKAWDSSVASGIDRLMKWYPLLLSFGWSRTEIEMALEMGYSVENHVVHSRCRWSWKYGQNAEHFHWWIEHSYRQLKAEEIGLSLKDFIALWRGFVTKEPMTQWHGQYRRLDARETLAYYLRARRRGLGDYEIRYTLLHKLDRFESYLKLRKKFDEEFVARLLDASWEDYRRLEEKYVVEAFRLGASREEVLRSVNKGRLHELALTLRRAQRASDE